MASKMYFLFLVAMLVQISLQIEVNTKDCGSDYSSFSNLRIYCEEGSTNDVCILRKGRTYTSAMDLTPNTIIYNGTFDVYQEVGKKIIPFSMKFRTLCAFHDVLCPLKGYATVVLKSEFDVSWFAMSGSSVIKTVLKIYSGQHIFCMKFAADVQ